MPNIFVISDTHFGHENILNFTKEDGTRLRTFSSVEEMDEHMIDCWNHVVRPQDKVYHLGDVAMRREDIDTIGRCHGHKRLVRGNHDDHALKYYLPWFEEIYGSRVIDGLLMTHIPIHGGSIKPKWTNVHGHLHSNHPWTMLGPKYFNVSVEMIDYTPVSIEDVKLRIIRQWEEHEHREASDAIL